MINDLLLPTKNDYDSDTTTHLYLARSKNAEEETATGDPLYDMSTTIITQARLGYKATTWCESGLPTQ